jgi:hypothetical protein
MERRQFLRNAGAIGAGAIGAAAVNTAAQSNASKGDSSTVRPIPLLANDPVILYESPDPPKVYAYSPGITRLPSGRLVATMDQGVRDTRKLPDLKVGPDGKRWTGKIYTSDDHGKIWAHRSDMPLFHARPFVAGDALYVLGHAGDLGVMRSTDAGETWEGAFWLTEGERWHQAPCNVHYANGKVYLVMERNTQPDFRGWSVSVLAPVVIAADVNADLTKRESWTFSNELSFRDAVKEAGPPNLVGVPFFAIGSTAPESKKDKRGMAPIGWLETNVVQFTDSDHVWYDPDGHTFHLWMRAHTGTTNLACIAKAVEAEDGSITVSLEKSPCGNTMLYVPCPGGQMKFHILRDDEAGLFWLLSSQSTDSMTRPDRLPDNRYNLPNNERHRLVLHFSTNCVDWCFAGRVADSGDYGQGRHYASMVIDGDDLHILSRSGDHRAKSAHDGNLITFHTVKDFRSLRY